MKKVTVLLMSLLLVFSLTACGSRDGGETVPDTEPAEEVLSETSGTEEENGEEAKIQQPEETEGQEEPAAEPETEEPAAETEAGGKVLVVYYSATGNTESVANYIAEATGADMLKLEPVEPYSGADLDWADQNSRVVYEHDNPEARKMELVAATVDDWDSYDTVFIGYPIWWFNAPMAVGTFLESYDLTGKTIVPFCTSTDNGIDVSMDYIREVSEGATVLDGKRIHKSDLEYVSVWLQDIGMLEQADKPEENEFGHVTPGTEEYRGFVIDNVFHSVSEGDIHYNVYIPESYDGSSPYGLYVTLPGYEGLYFQGVASNIKSEEFGFEAQKYKVR